MFRGRTKRRRDFIEHVAPLGAAAVLVLACVYGLFPSEANAYATPEGPPIYSSAPGLPDGRIYEQVSPTDTNGNEAGATTVPEAAGANFHYGLATAGGDSVLFEGTGPMGESPSGQSQYFVAGKNPSAAGWGTRALMPGAQYAGKLVSTLEAKPYYLDASSDLSHALVEAEAYALGPESSQCTEEAGGVGTFQLWLTGPDPFLAATWLEQPTVKDPVENCAAYKESGAPAGGTPDFSTVYFTYPGTLLPTDAERAPHAQPREQGDANVEAWGFYEDREGGLREAGVLPDGGLDPFGAVPAASGHGRSRVGNEVSENGSRAFFVSPDPASCEQTVIRVGGREIRGQNNCALDPPELYVRESEGKGPEAHHKTVLVSQDTLLPAAGGLPASAPGVGGVLRMPNPTQQGRGAVIVDFSGSYVFASADGSQAFFQSEDALTKPAEEASPGTEPKTYDFDVSTGTLTYLPNVVGQILATDTEGTSFAFVRPEAGGEPAQLDLWSGPGAGRVTPVTQLPGETVPSSAEARISSDGSVLVFITGAQLSAAFNSDGGEQIYRYDASTDTLGCVSCPPHGVTLPGGPWISALEHGEEAFDPAIVDVRGVSANGDRVFFDTSAPLVPQDTNTSSPAIEVAQETFEQQGEDVYEWENGVVYLISSGKSARDSYLLDNSESGGDVFFATTDALTPGHTDGGYAVYDARVPQPGDNPPPAAVPCEGSVCQGPPHVESPVAPPARATLPGSDNLVSEPASVPPAKPKTKTVKCPKGKKLSHGRCVKSKPKKARRAKKAGHSGRAK